MGYWKNKFNKAVDAFIWGLMISAALHLTGVRFVGVVIGAD